MKKEKEKGKEKSSPALLSFDKKEEGKSSRELKKERKEGRSSSAVLLVGARPEKGGSSITNLRGGKGGGKGK